MIKYASSLPDYYSLLLFLRNLCLIIEIIQLGFIIIFTISKILVLLKVFWHLELLIILIFLLLLRVVFHLYTFNLSKAFSLRFEIFRHFLFERKYLCNIISNSGKAN